MTVGASCCEHVWSPPTATGRYCMLCDEPMPAASPTPAAIAEEQARAIARAICVEYGLNPAEFEPSGGEHPIIHVIVKHVAPALAEIRSSEEAIARGLFERGRGVHDAASWEEAGDEMRDWIRGHARAIRALTKLDQQEGRR